MPTLDISKTYAANRAPLKSDIDNICDGIETFLNVTKLDDSNIQTNTLTNTVFAANCVTDTKIASSVAGAGITGGVGNPLAVYVDNTTTYVTNTNQVALKDGGLAVVHLNTNTLNINTSGDSGAFVFNAASGDVNVTNQTVVLNTSGLRPVMLFLQPSNTAPAHIDESNAALSGAIAKVFRGSTEIERIELSKMTSVVGNIFTIDGSAAATSYTYRLSAELSGIGSASINFVRLTAWEIF